MKIKPKTDSLLGAAVATFGVTFVVATLSIAVVRGDSASAMPFAGNGVSFAALGNVLRAAGDKIALSIGSGVRVFEAPANEDLANAPSDVAVDQSGTSVPDEDMPVPEFGVQVAEADVSDVVNEADDERAAALALRGVRARAYLGLKDYPQARAEAQAILAESPNDRAALQVMGALEDGSGRWQQALKYWTQLETVHGDKAAAERRAAIRAAHRSSVSITGFYEGSDSDKQFGGRAAVNIQPLKGPEWNVTLEQRRAEADLLVDQSGRSGAFSGDRQRVQVEAAQQIEHGRISGRITATNDAVGVGGAIEKGTGWGKVRAEAAANESSWLYSAGIANKAVADMVAVGVEAVRGLVSGRAKAGYTNYGIDSDRTLANSARVTIGADVAMSRSPNAARLSYVMDGEYFGSTGEKRRSNGTSFQPIPFADREVHSLGVSKMFGDRQRSNVTLGAGYRADRFGGNGAFGSISGEAALAKGVKLGVRSEYSEVSSRNEQNAGYTFGEVFLKKEF